MIRFYFAYFIRPLVRFQVRIIVIAVGDHPFYANLYQLVLKETTDIAKLRTRSLISNVVTDAYKMACGVREQACKFVIFYEKCFILAV